MAKLPLYLVLPAIIMLVVLHSSDSRTNNMNKTSLVLLFIKNRLSVSVYPNGQINSTSNNPTLYSLFRVQSFGQGMEGRRYTLEAVASDHFLCMNEHGQLQAQKRTDSTGIRRKKKRSPPSSLCVFNSYHFKANQYRNSLALYVDNLRSNGTSGKFVAFTKKGLPKKKRFVRKLQNLREYPGISINFRNPPLTSSLIENTPFERCDGKTGTPSYNKSIRNCLLANQSLMDPRKLRHQNVFNKIQECKRKKEEKICQRSKGNRRKSKKEKASPHSTDLNRSTMRQNSTQRMHPTHSCFCSPSALL